MAAYPDDPENLLKNRDSGETSNLYRIRRVFNFVAISLLSCCLVSGLMLLFFYPLLVPTTPTADIRSFSQRFKVGHYAGIVPFDVIWDVAFRFSNPGSHTLLSYNNLVASISWLGDCPKQSIRLAEARLPDFRQGTRAATVIESVLKPVDFLNVTGCKFPTPVGPDLLGEETWRLRLEVYGDYRNRAFGSPWSRARSSRLGCNEVALVSPHWIMIGEPTDCTT